MRIDRLVCVSIAATAVLSFHGIANAGFEALLGGYNGSGGGSVTWLHSSANGSGPDLQKFFKLSGTNIAGFHISGGDAIELQTGDVITQRNTPLILSFDRYEGHTVGWTATLEITNLVVTVGAPASGGRFHLGIAGDTSSAGSLDWVFNVNFNDGGSATDFTSNGTAGLGGTRSGRFDKAHIDSQGRLIIDEWTEMTDLYRGLIGTNGELLEPDGSGGMDLGLRGSTHAPEPASMALLGIGGIGLLGYGRRRKRKADAVTAA